MTSQLVVCGFRHRTERGNVLCTERLVIRVQYGSVVYGCPLHGIRELIPCVEPQPLYDGCVGDEPDDDLETFGL